MIFTVAGPSASAQTPDSTTRIVRGLSFHGNKALDAERLAASISTTNSDWLARFVGTRWLGIGGKRAFDEQEFQRDVIRLRLLYRASGYPAAVIDTTVRRVEGKHEVSVYVNFKITEGTPVVVKSFEVVGLDSVAPRPRTSVLRDLPLEVGDPFDRLLLQSSIDTVARRMRNRGFPDVDVFREFTSDVPKRVADITLTVEPGPRARLGPLRVEGSERIDSGLTRGLTGLQPGRIYSEDRLFQAQRLLYRADLYRFASVSIDTANRVKGDSLVPLVIRTQESPRTRLRLGAGYGTTDCFRASSGLLLRDFAGEGNLLEFTGNVSKIGVGAPTNAGLASNICNQLAQDTIGSRLLNYQAQVTLRRPTFFGFQNSLALSAFAARRSEFTVYLRQEIGFSATVTREGPRRRFPISLGYTVTRGRTTAVPATFCTSFGACTPELIALQQETRTLGLLTFSVSMPRVNNQFDPTNGTNASFEISHSDTWLGSSGLNKFTRAIGEVSAYHTLAKGFVLSGRVRAGIIFAPQPPTGSSLDSLNASFVPLEQRFFAGGPNDVRGFQRNQLGPVVFAVRSDTLANQGNDPTRLNRNTVTVSATGGNTLAVSNIELRTPSPFWTDKLHFAFFVDAGTVWQRGGGAVTPVAIRVTPGFGIRFATPLGPFRLDLAYNPNGLDAGRLFSSDPTTGVLTQVTDTYRLPRSSIPITLHVSVGQAF